jgi:uncharacterized protein (DUF2342 family)
MRRDAAALPWIADHLPRLAVYAMDALAPRAHAASTSSNLVKRISVDAECESPLHEGIVRKVAGTRENAIEIANALLAEGYDESRAIRVAIAQAKRWAGTQTRNSRRRP